MIFRYVIVVAVSICICLLHFFGVCFFLSSLYTSAAVVGLLLFLFVFLMDLSTLDYSNALFIADSISISRFRTIPKRTFAVCVCVCFFLLSLGKPFSILHSIVCAVILFCLNINATAAIYINESSKTKFEYLLLPQCSQRKRYRFSIVLLFPFDECVCVCGWRRSKIVVE